jgi:hypothetical protein
MFQGVVLWDGRRGGRVTVMTQITCDAVYSGSDLFIIVVYSNEL